MSNRVSLTYTKFTNLLDEGGEAEYSYGYRIYDDYGLEYNNCFDSFAELKCTVNKDNIKDYIAENHSGFLESIEYKEGLYFNNDWVEIE